MKTSNMVPLFHSYGERCWKTQNFCCGINNNNNIHFHLEWYFNVMNNNLPPLQRKMNNNDEYLFYADVRNKANSVMTSFLYNWKRLLHANVVQCKGQALLYHIDRQKNRDDNYQSYNKVVYQINRETNNKYGEYWQNWKFLGC